MNEETKGPELTWPVVSPVTSTPQTESPEDEIAKANAAKEIVKWARGQMGEGPARRRADWAYNPNDVYVCPNGHLQYNLSPEEQDEMRARGEKPLSPCYEGGLCRHCTEYVSKLTADPKELQEKLGTAMKTVAQLYGRLAPLEEANRDMNVIALFLRENYGDELVEGREWFGGALSKAVTHYLQIERGRARVRAGKWVRAIGRALGVR